MNKAVMFGLVGLLITETGCKRQDIKYDASNFMGEEIESVAFDDEPSLRGTPELNSNLKVVHFNFDKTDLTPESLEILKENAAYLLKNPYLKIIIEGHTDDRGTSEYNLSLGQRRALKVKDYYVSFGIASNRIATISYGREKPVIDEHSETAWLENRRVETKVISN
ncbi:MAG: peptidoglycan-associated lipoprotein Pal [Endomicrobium sp.]|jgi:peptidoglycan-associated lipoprotein|nr:peptidoglycan-associated lipoprotein Pal [Endomicrobium sp.]